MVKALFIVTSDPATSHRPAEAIRIAAGVGAWRKVEVHLYFHGPAVRCLSEFPEELIQGGNIERYLPMVAECGQLLADTNARELADVGEPSMPYAKTDTARVASIASQSACVLHF